MISKTFKATIFFDGSMCFIPLPFDPKPVFGKVRAPVNVTVNGYAAARFRQSVEGEAGGLAAMADPQLQPSGRARRRDRRREEARDAGPAHCPIGRHAPDS
jgi:hypothetical protein